MMAAWIRETVRVVRSSKILNNSEGIKDMICWQIRCERKELSRRIS